MDNEYSEIVLPFQDFIRSVKNRPLLAELFESINSGSISGQVKLQPHYLSLLDILPHGLVTKISVKSMETMQARKF